MAKSGSKWKGPAEVQPHPHLFPRAPFRRLNNPTISICSRYQGHYSAGSSTSLHPFAACHCARTFLRCTPFYLTCNVGLARSFATPCTPLRRLLVLEMGMAPRKGTRRACDPCSVRKVRCDGNQPCSRCEAAKFECSYLKIHGKSGPKGPRRTTEAAIRRLQARSRSGLQDRAASESDTSFDGDSPSTVDFPLLDPLQPPSDPPFGNLGWPDNFSPSIPATSTEPQRLSTTSLSVCLEVYKERGYAIWPVVETDSLVARLLTHPDDMEAYALATAICAATTSQFQFDAEVSAAAEGHTNVSSALFEAEAKRGRDASDHMEHVTIWSLLSTFFLHVCSANVGRMAASTILLGEAITKAHMIGLHRFSYYRSMSVEQQQYNLRIYWLLFITER